MHHKYLGEIQRAFYLGIQENTKIVQSQFNVKTLRENISFYIFVYIIKEIYLDDGMQKNQEINMFLSSFYYTQTPYENFVRLTSRDIPLFLESKVSFLVSFISTLH